MFITQSSDAIFDLPAFILLKKALVLLFREPKNLSTPLLSPNAPRQCSSPSSRKAHEYHGPPSTTNRFVRAGPEHPAQEMVHPTDPNARAQSSTDEWGRLPPAAILHNIHYLPRGGAGHVEVASALSLIGIMPLEYTEGADHPLQLPYRVEVEGYVCTWGPMGTARPFSLIRPTSSKNLKMLTYYLLVRKDELP